LIKNPRPTKKKKKSSRYWCLMPIIPDTHRTETRRIETSPGKVVLEDSILKISNTKKGLAEWLK
jgi:hypothetical protein